MMVTVLDEGTTLSGFSGTFHVFGFLLLGVSKF